MNRRDFEIDVLCDYSVKTIEWEIVHAYNNTRCRDLDSSVLLSLRKNIINKEMLAHQKDLLPDIVAFRVSDFTENIFFSYEMQQVSNDCALVMIF